MTDYSEFTMRNQHYTNYATLCVLGQHCQANQILARFEHALDVKQKTIIHSPTKKLLSVMLGMLMGNTSIYELNTTLRADPAVWYSFGLQTCADQSGLQRTLEACSAENVAQLSAFNAWFFQNYGQASEHDFTKEPLVLDLDLSGLPCSKHSQAATKGYFAKARGGTTGRQLARVSATDYDEIVFQQVFSGNTSSRRVTLRYSKKGSLNIRHQNTKGGHQEQR